MDDNKIKDFYENIVKVQLPDVNGLKTFEEFRSFNLNLLKLVKEHGFKLGFMEAFVRKTSKIENYYDWFDGRTEDEFSTIDEIISVVNDWYDGFPDSYDTEKYVLDLNFNLK